MTEAERGFVLIVLGAAAVMMVLAVGLILIGNRAYRRRMYQPVADIRTAIEAGDLDEARRLARSWENRVKPRDAFQRAQVARSWSRIGDHEQALTTLSASKVPKGRIYRSFRRMLDELRYSELIALDRTAEADWLLTEAVDQDPGAPWLVQALAERALRNDDRRGLDVALEHAARFAAVHPGDLHAGLALLTASLARGDFAGAATALDEFLPRIEAKARKVPGVTANDLSALYALHGMVRLASGDDARAEEAFVAASARASDPAAAAQVAKARADGYFNAHRFQEAAGAYEQILASDEDGNALLALIESRRQLGTRSGVPPELQRAKDMGGDAKWAMLLEARLLSDEGRGQDAERTALDGAGGDRPTDLTALYTLGYVRASNDLPGAEETLRRWVALFPERDDLDEILDAPILGGGTWRERISVEPRPDLSA